MNKITAQLLLLFITPLVLAAQTAEVASPKAPEEISFDDGFHDIFDNIDDMSMPTRDPSPGDIYDLLRNPAFPPSAIIDELKTKGPKEPLWKHTNAPVGRDILYLLPHKITSIEYGGFAANLFFNMTSNMKISADSLLQFDQINDIAKIFTNGSESSPITDLPVLLALFRKTNIQEHKGGVLFQGGLTRGPFSLHLNTALQLVERNLWLNEDDQAAIKAMVTNFVPGMQIHNREGMKVAGGFGDARLKLGVNTLNMNSLQVDVGAEAILPTSSLSYVPKMQIASHATPTAFAELLDRSLDMIKSVRDYVLEPRMGNNGHVGLGCYFESKVGLFHDVANAWFRLSYDKFLGNDERRLFMYKKVLDVNSLPTSSTGDDTFDKPQDIQTIYQYFQQYIVPSGFKASIEPGGVFNFISSVDFKLSKRFKYALGYDFYAQQDEKIIKIVGSDASLDDLVVEKTEQGAVRQHKLYSELMYFMPQKRSDLSVGGGGDVTVASTNMGKDWTVYLKCAASF